MNAFTANLDAVAVMGLEAFEASGYLPRPLFFKMLSAPGGIAPLTAEGRKAARAAKAAKVAAKATPAAPARKPVSDAQRRFYASYHARKRRAAATDIAA